MKLARLSAVPLHVMHSICCVSLGQKVVGVFMTLAPVHCCIDALDAPLTDTAGSTCGPFDTIRE